MTDRRAQMRQALEINAAILAAVARARKIPESSIFRLHHDKKELGAWTIGGALDLANEALEPLPAPQSPERRKGPDVERYRRAVQLRRDGLTLKEIGKELGGITGGRVREILGRYERMTRAGRWPALDAPVS